MIDNEQLLVRICGEGNVEAFKDVKKASMRLARAVKEVIADDLHGSIPVSGKQFLTTPRGVWRLAPRANSDNSTEVAANKLLGARLVQIFGDLTEYRRAKGWITAEELYELHGVRFDADQISQRVVSRASQAS